MQTYKVKDYIPDFLTDAKSAQKVVAREIKRMSEGLSSNYFFRNATERFGNEMLQGDGWSGFQLFDFYSGERRFVKGIVISNSCNVSTENPHDSPVYVTFAPLIKLSDIENILKDFSSNSKETAEKVGSIRKQKNYRYFYLPPDQTLDCECIAKLDELHTMPISEHKNKERLFTLNQSAFYFFIVKLSILFCRMHENINRQDSI